MIGGSGRTGREIVARLQADSRSVRMLGRHQSETDAEMVVGSITDPDDVGRAGSDADAAWQRALDAGAKVFHELEDAFWGERHGQFIDPFGHRWGVAQRQEEIPPEEVER